MTETTRLLFAVVFATATGYVIFNAPMHYKIFVVAGMLIIGVLMLAEKKRKTQDNASHKEPTKLFKK